MPQKEQKVECINIIITYSIIQRNKSVPFDKLRMKGESKMFITIEKISYEVTGIIGQGAASVVYLAKQAKGEGKSVAIKNIRNYKDPIMKEAVNAEIKIQSSFKDCPYVIQYLGVEAHDKQVFIALELGQYTLRKFIEMKSFRQIDLVLMLNNVLEGLYYIHKNVVIHRDIKPENIIFQEDIFKITDFGVSSEGTEDENFVGTPLYFPPEMLFDNNLKYTQKVDVWSLGVSAFQSYFKINPFFYSENKVMHQTLKQMKENIRVLTPNFTMDKFLSHITKKGLIKEVVYVEKKLKNTKEEVLENLCAFFQPNPEDRIDSEYCAVVWKSIKDSLSIIKTIQKTKVKAPFKRGDLPCDIEFFCRTKDMFYEIDNQHPYKSEENTKLNVLEAIQFAIWFTEGRVYRGLNYIELDSFEKISHYQPKQDQLWRQIGKTLQVYYWTLKADEQYQFYSKISQLRLFILCCGIWPQILKNEEVFCKRVKNISEFECVTIFEVLKYAGLCSESSLNQIEQELLQFY